MSVIDTLVTDRTSTTATYEASDLNRVEEAVAYIIEHAEAVGVILSAETKTDWTRDDMPTAEEMARYILNIKSLRTHLTILPTTPEAPKSMNRLTFIGANNIEQILKDVDRLITNTIDGWSYAGDIFAGEMIS